MEFHSFFFCICLVNSLQLETAKLNVRIYRRAGLFLLRIRQKPIVSHGRKEQSADAWVTFKLLIFTLCVSIRPSGQTEKQHKWYKKCFATSLSS